jgi:general secretion pathway protein E
VEPFLISSTLLGVIAQRLVRNICPHCQEAFLLSREELDNLGLDLPADSQVDTIEMKRGKGCRQCRSTGYIGREGVFEVLRVTEELRRFINRKELPDVIKKIAQKQGMKLLKENAVAKVLKGRTTYNEVLRCVNQGD